MLCRWHIEEWEVHQQLYMELPFNETITLSAFDHDFEHINHYIV
jgi:hypothetical protein